MDELAAVVTHNMEPTPRILLFGFVSMPTSILVSWLCMAILIVASILLTRNLKREPGKLQALLEIGIGWFANVCTTQLGIHGKRYAPFLGSLALFLLTTSLTGLFHIPPPTKSLSVTGGAALFSVLLIYGAQFRHKGFVGGLKHFAKPVPLLLPINLLEVVIRPTSLCMRLFGNILAATIVMDMLNTLVPVLVPAVFAIYFEFFDAGMQTTVFVFLTMLFLAESIGAHEEEHTLPAGG